jgi:hypothetical protein
VSRAFLSLRGASTEEVLSTTSLTTGEPLEKSFSESLISSKSRSIGPDFVTFGPE